MDDRDFKAFIERVKLAAPIEDVVGQRVRGLKRAGANWKACCPFHDEATPSFVVTPARGTWHCFGACNEGGDAISFVQRDTGLGFREAVEELAKGYGVELPRGWGQGQGQDPRQAAAYEVLERAQAFYARKLAGPEGAAARAYLVQRGLEPALGEAFGLGFAPAGNSLVRSARDRGLELEALVDAGLVRVGDHGPFDFFRERLLFPIRDAFGRTVGFGARLLPGAEGPKYVNTPETPLFQKSRLVYGLDRARESIRRERHAILVEGYTDVIAAHQVGLRQVVAVLGTATTPDHARALRRCGAQRITLLFDGDAAGRRAAARALAGLLGQEGLHLDVASLPEGLDPCDAFLGPERAALEQRLSTGQSWYHFLADGLRGAEPEVLGRGVAELLRLLARLPNPVERDARLAELADRLELSREAVREHWNQVRAELAREERPAGPRAERSAAGSRPARPPEAAGAGAPRPQAGSQAPSAASPAALRRRRAASRAAGEVVGALLLDNSLIPARRAQVEDLAAEVEQVDGRIGRVLSTLFALYDADVDGELPLDASAVMTALGADPHRGLAVVLESHARLAEDPRQLLDGALATLERLRTDRARRAERQRAAAGSDREQQLLEAANRTWRSTAATAAPLSSSAAVSLPAVSSPVDADDAARRPSAPTAAPAPLYGHPSPPHEPTSARADVSERPSRAQPSTTHSFSHRTSAPHAGGGTAQTHG